MPLAQRCARPLVLLAWMALITFWSGQNNLFRGLGKPEPLKHRGGDYWSRRITQEHRLVYLVRADRVVFLQARYHY